MKLNDIFASFIPQLDMQQSKQEFLQGTFCFIHILAWRHSGGFQPSISQ